MATEHIISLTSPAFEKLIELMLAHLDEKYGVGEANKWISTEEAMKMLQIKSKTTMQQLRAEGKVRYSQPLHKVVLYDKHSLNEYLEKHVHETF